VLSLDEGGAETNMKRNRTGEMLMDFGRNMELDRSLGTKLKLKEEEEAAILLMSLSSGSLCTY